MAAVLTLLTIFLTCVVVAYFVALAALVTVIFRQRFLDALFDSIRSWYEDKFN